MRGTRTRSAAVFACVTALAATLSTGLGPAGATNPGVPAAPSIDRVLAGDRSVTVSFAPGYTGNDPTLIFGASCTSSDAGFDGYATGWTSPIFVSGLTRGRTYSCRVFASNAAGTSRLSAPSTAFTLPPPPARAPFGPTNAKALRAGKGVLLVSFTPPASDGGAPILRYSAICRSSNSGVGKQVTTKVGPITVTGLTAGRTYSCRVAATNVRGTGPASTASPNVVA